ncbi:MAG: prephenate dehydratase [bacterium]|nr:prephenate dehydratase [bacterium]
MKLENIREQINRIDYQLIKLLNHRMEWALKTRKLKKGVTDGKREEQVLANIADYPNSLLTEEFSRFMFRGIMEESKRLQEDAVQLIGFQGTHGANSESAVGAYDSTAAPVPCRHFVDVFDGLQSNVLDLGVIPVENSLEGAVTEVNDLLIDRAGEYVIVGEIRQRISHCLLSLPDTNYHEIKIVYSHPQALAQCRGFLNRNKLEGRPYYDTAGAAEMLSSEQPGAAAAIAAEPCAKLYGLDIIKEDIADSDTNYTRFLVIAPAGKEVEGNKCSIAFSTHHQAGALYGILGMFAEADVNLTRIESRPKRNNPGKYTFLLDFNGSHKEAKVSDLLEAISQKSDSYKFLGCYMETEQ